MASANGRGRPKSNFVFVNIANPKESKEKNNRQIVSKYAMLNRPKGAVSPTPLKPPASVSSDSPPATRITTPDANPQFLTPSVQAYRRNNSSQPAFSTEYFGVSAQEQSNTPSVEDDSTVGILSFPVESSKTPKPSYLSTKRNNRKQVSKRRHRQTEKVRENDVRDERRSIRRSPVARTPSTPASPTSVLGSVGDPFESLPIKGDPHTQELLHLYLHAHLVSETLTVGNPGIINRLKDYRQSFWFPLAKESEATSHALVAYVESTPNMGVPKREKYLLHHIGMACKSISKAIADDNANIDDHICLAVNLLMITAQRRGAYKDYQVHAKGLATILSKRANAYRKSRKMREEAQARWISLKNVASGSSPSDPCAYCKSKEQDMQSPRLYIDPGAQPIPMINPKKRGAGFYDLIDRGVLSEASRSFIFFVIIWSDLADKARADKFSAASAATHAWVEEDALPPIDFICKFTVRLCLTLHSWLDGWHSCAIVRQMVRAVYKSLRQIDVGTLVEKAPHLTLWISVIAGTYAEAMPRLWFSCLLNCARSALADEAFTFDSFVAYSRQNFIWSGTMTAAAERFWYEIDFDAAYAKSCMETITLSP